MSCVCLDPEGLLVFFSPFNTAVGCFVCSFIHTFVYFSSAYPSIYSFGCFIDSCYVAIGKCVPETSISPAAGIPLLRVRQSGRRKQYS